MQEWTKGLYNYLDIIAIGAAIFIHCNYDDAEHLDGSTITLHTVVKILKCQVWIVGMLGYGMAKAAVHQLTKGLGENKSGLPANSVAVAILP